MEVVLVVVCVLFWENCFLSWFGFGFSVFVCVFGVFGIDESSSRAKAGDAEGGTVLFVLLLWFMGWCCLYFCFICCCRFSLLLY